MSTYTRYLTSSGIELKPDNLGSSCIFEDWFGETSATRDVTMKLHLNVSESIETFSRTLHFTLTAEFISGQLDGNSFGINLLGSNFLYVNDTSLRLTQHASWSNYAVAELTLTDTSDVTVRLSSRRTIEYNSSTYNYSNVSTDYYQLKTQGMATASRISFNSSVAVIGQQALFSITSDDASYTHKVVATCGGLTETVITGQPAGTYGYTIPSTVSTGSTLTLTCTTYAGSAPFPTTTTATITCYVVVSPTVTTHACVPVNSSEIPSSMRDIYFKGATRLRASITGTTPEGSSITLNRVTYDGRSQSENDSSGTYYFDCLTAGTRTVSFYVKNNTGGSASVTETINVVEYSPPQILAATGYDDVKCYRCDSTGQAATDGSYLMVHCKMTSSNVSYNRATLTCEINGTYFTTLIAATNQTTEFSDKFDANLSPQTTYKITLRAQDLVGGFITRDFTVGVTDVAIDIRNKLSQTAVGDIGIGIGIGGLADPLISECISYLPLHVKGKLNGCSVLADSGYGFVDVTKDSQSAGPGGDDIAYFADNAGSGLTLVRFVYASGQAHPNNLPVSGKSCYGILLKSVGSESEYKSYKAFYIMASENTDNATSLYIRAGYRTAGSSGTTSFGAWRTL